MAVFKIEGVGKEQERIFTAVTHADGITLTCFTKQSATYAVQGKLEMTFTSQVVYKVPADQIYNKVTFMKFIRLNST